MSPTQDACDGCDDCNGGHDGDKSSVHCAQRRACPPVHSDYEGGGDIFAGMEATDNKTEEELAQEVRDETFRAINETAAQIETLRQRVVERVRNSVPPLPPLQSSSVAVSAGSHVPSPRSELPEAPSVADALGKGLGLVRRANGGPAAARETLEPLRPSAADERRRVAQTAPSVAAGGTTPLPIVGAPPPTAEPAGSATTFQPSYVAPMAREAGCASMAGAGPLRPSCASPLRSGGGLGLAPTAVSPTRDAGGWQARPL